jgi:hypothetical protein
LPLPAFALPLPAAGVEVAPALGLTVAVMRAVNQPVSVSLKSIDRVTKRQRRRKGRTGDGSGTLLSDAGILIGLDCSREILLVLQNLGLNTLQCLCCFYTLGEREYTLHRCFIVLVTWAEKKDLARTYQKRLYQCDQCRQSAEQRSIHQRDRPRRCYGSGLCRCFR